MRTVKDYLPFIPVGRWNRQNRQEAAQLLLPACGRPPRPLRSLAPLLFILWEVEMPMWEKEGRKGWEHAPPTECLPADLCLSSSCLPLVTVGIGMKAVRGGTFYSWRRLEKGHVLLPSDPHPFLAFNFFPRRRRKRQRGCDGVIVCADSWCSHCDFIVVLPAFPTSYFNAYRDMGHGSTYFILLVM